MRHHRALLLLTLGYWRRRPGRVALMLLGVAAGIALLGAVLLVNDALLRTYAGWARGVHGWADVEVRAVADRGFPRALAARLAAVEGVEAAAPSVERRSYLLRGEGQVAVSVRGVDPAAEAALRPLALVAGRGLEPGDRQVTLLSYAASLALDAPPGSDVELLTPYGLETLRVVGVYHRADDGTGPVERAALAPLAAVQEMFEDGRDAVTRVDVAVAGRALAEVEAELSALVGASAYVRPARHALSEQAAASADLRALLLLAGVLAAVAAALLIVVHARAMLDERAPDLALLRALGVTRARLRRWLAVEVAALVVLGAVPGVPLAVPGARLLLGYLPGELLAPFGASFVAPRLGAAAFLTPAMAWLVVAGAATWACALALRELLGRLAARLEGASERQVWLRLGGALLRRRRGQAATAAAALTLTLAGLVGIHGVADASRRSLASWLDAAVTWDLRVAAGPGASGAAVALPGEAAAQVAALPGVAAVTTERQLTVASGGRGITVIALGGSAPDLGQRLRVVQAADLGGSERPAATARVAVSEQLAARLALSVGDRLPLTTHAGESDYTVVAVVDDSANRGEAAYVELDAYLAAWGDGGVDSITVRLTPGAEAASVARAVSESTGLARAKVPLHVTLADAYREELLAGVSGVYAGVKLVVLLAVLVALVGVLGSSVSAAWQLEPETRLLRSLGAQRRLVAGVLGLALALTAGLGAAAGAGLGTLLSLRLSATMSGAAAPLAWHWPLESYAVVALLLLLTAGCAALLLTPSLRWAVPRSGRR